jgi:hypothetical protein
MTEEKMTQYLNAWYEQGEKDCKTEAYAYVTDFVKVPALDSTSYQKMRWKIKEGVMAEIEVQQYPAEGDGTISFRFKKPRIASEKNIKVSGIFVVINGETNPAMENAFEKVDQLILGRSFNPTEAIIPFPVLAVEELISLPHTDHTPTIGLAFKKLQENAAGVVCKNQVAFETSLLPEIKTSCLSCHADSSTDAYKRFDMTTSPATLCEEFSSRGGILYEMAVKGRAGHTPIVNPQASNRFKRAFSLWNI